MECENICVCGKIFNKNFNLIRHQKICSLMNELSINNENNQNLDCICGKKYKYLNSFKKHKLKCEIYKNNILSLESLNKKKENNYEIMKKLSENFEKLTEKINNTNSNYNTYNNQTYNNYNNQNIYILNYLNDQCKDALSIEEYVKNINISIKDFDKNSNDSIVTTIDKIFVNPMLNMDINTRPIHYTNNQNPEFYIKDKNEWTYKQSKNKIMNSIIDVTKRLTDFLYKWKQINNDWLDDEDKQQIVMNYMNSIIDIYDSKIEKKILNMFKQLNLKM